MAAVELFAPISASFVPGIKMPGRVGIVLKFCASAQGWVCKEISGKDQDEND
jgi:hypothetical protein